MAMAETEGYKTIEWNDLMPDSWVKEMTKEMAALSKMSYLQDTSDEANKAMNAMRKKLDDAPIVKTQLNKKIKHINNNLKKELSGLALHVNLDETFGGTQSGNTTEYFGSIIPLQKNVLEFKNNKLFIYDKQGNYKEIDVSVLPEGTTSIVDFKIENLEIDFDDFYLTDSYYRCPFFFKELQIGFKENIEDRNYNIEDRNYYYNDDLVIQKLPLYGTIPMFGPNLITYYEATGYSRNGMLLPHISIESYLKNMLKYAEYKKNGDLEKANKSLLKAEKDINVFKEKYSIYY
jgi:hypothetical protein